MLARNTCSHPLFPLWLRSWIPFSSCQALLMDLCPEEGEGSTFFRQEPCQGGSWGCKWVSCKTVAFYEESQRTPCSWIPAWSLLQFAALPSPLASGLGPLHPCCVSHHCWCCPSSNVATRSLLFKP